MQVSKMIILAVICLFLSGCTLHFKATELEVDAERQRVEGNTTYQLEKIFVLK